MPGRKLAGLQIEPDHTKDHWLIEQLYYHDRKNRSLAVRYPELAQEWSEQNRERPDVIPSREGKKRWWKCPKCEKEYQATVHNRVRNGSACPYCAHLKVREDTSLAAVYPEVAAEWHDEKNAPLRPEDVLPGTDKRVWWRCNKGHEWRALIYVRTGPKPSKCPVCQGHTVIPETSLAAVEPELAKWWHPTKNEKQPTEVAPYSNKMFWWQCEKGHEWQNMPLQLRSRDKNKLCPVCNAVKLQTRSELCLKEQNPSLARYWHPGKNQIQPENVAPFSQKTVWWCCPKGHEWQSRIADMQNIKRKEYCPWCGGRRIWEENCLKALAPHLAEQWHPTKNQPLTPSDISPLSSRKIWWQCEKGHEWQAPPAKRYQRKDGCPYCSGHRACMENCLAVRYPEVAKQWNTERNGALTPYDVTPNSSKKVWWKCEQGHEWELALCYRVHNKGCPYCDIPPVQHGTLPEERPELLKQWDYEKNPLPPEQYRVRSNRKVWWKCEMGHSWMASPDGRYKGSDCPYCYRKEKE